MLDMEIDGDQANGKRLLNLRRDLRKQHRLFRQELLRKKLDAPQSSILRFFDKI